MLTVDHYARIRQLRRDGLTIRQIADQLNHSPKTILKALANPEPVPAARPEPRPAPVFGPFREAVDAILAADEADHVAATLVVVLARIRTLAIRFPATCLYGAVPCGLVALAGLARLRKEVLCSIEGEDHGDCQSQYL